MKKLTRLPVIPTNSAGSLLRPCCTTAVIPFKVCVLLGSLVRLEQPKAIGGTMFCSFRLRHPWMVLG